MKTFTEKRFGEWDEDEISITIRNRSGSCGGGSEVLVICSRYVQSDPHKRNNDGTDSCKAGLSQDSVRDIDL